MTPTRGCNSARPKDRAEFSAAKDASPRAELLLRLKKVRNDAESGDESGDDDLADLQETEKEARLLALRLKRLEARKHEIWDTDKKGFRPAEWRDMAVLLRAPSGKAEIYAKEFQRAGVPLIVERGGFYDSGEIMDLLSLLQLLDNPLQDVPAIAVLRSPLAGLSLDELAQIRLAAKGMHFWTALNRGPLQFTVHSLQSTAAKVSGDKFLERFFPLAAIGAAGVTVTMPGKPAGRDALRRVAARAPARRATARQCRAISGSRAKV